MKTCRPPISHALTSFNGAATENGAPQPSKPVAKIHHLRTSPGKVKEGEQRGPLDVAIERSRDFFLREQLPEGYWWAELESNVTITAEYIMLFHFMGMGR